MWIISSSDKTSWYVDCVPPVRRSGVGRIGNMRSTECSFMDQKKPRSLLKDPPLKEFGGYSSRVVTSYEQWLGSKQDIVIWKAIYTTVATQVIFVIALLVLFSALFHLWYQFSLSFFLWFFSVAWPRFFGARCEFSQRLLLTGITNFKKVAIIQCSLIWLNAL